MKKEWCKHIKWIDRTWWMNFAPNYDSISIPCSWRACPICLTERPTRANIKAATIRFLIDNDQ